jgi:DNA-binding transcriptional MerR regulator
MTGHRARDEGAVHEPARNRRVRAPVPAVAEGAPPVPRTGAAGAARVDPASGYRWYAPEQLEQARLVASLRQIGVPLAQITSVLSLFRHVDGERGLAVLGKEFIGRLREQPVPRLEGIAGAAFLIFHGQVTEDSDGPVEWCRPILGDRAEEIAAVLPGLTLRTEPAHGEAYVHLGTGRVPTAEWPVIAESLHAWASEHQVRVSEQPDLGARVTYLAHPPITTYSRPDCDYAVTLAPGQFG